MGSRTPGGMDPYLNCDKLMVYANTNVRGVRWFVVRINWCGRKGGGSVHASPVFRNVLGEGET